MVYHNFIMFYNFLKNVFIYSIKKLTSFIYGFTNWFLEPRGFQIGEYMKRDSIKQFLTLILLIAMVFSTISIAYQVGSNQGRVVSVAGSSALSPNDVSSELNMTLSHMSYTTQPPQFMITSSNYAKNATYANVKSTSGIAVMNATYQIFQHNASSTAATTGSSLSYYMKGDTNKAKEYFSDSKVGFNGTGNKSVIQIIFGNLSHKSQVTPAAMAGKRSFNVTKAEVMGIDINATKNGSSFTYNASVFYYYTTGASGNGYVVNWSKMGGKPMQALNMYELQVNLQPKQQQVSFMYTNNGTPIQDTKIIKNTNATKTPYLNFTKMDKATYLLNPAKASGGLMLDWMYLVDQNTISYPSASSSVITSGSVISGASASLSPSFDPTSVANHSSYQNSNVSKMYNGVKISNNIFTSVLNASNSALQNSVGLNTSNKITSLESQFNGSEAVVTNAFTNTSNITITTNERVSSWTSKYINTLLVKYLKAYAATLAEKELKVYVSANDITLISYRIGSIFLDNTYTSSAAKQISTYLDNSYASLLAQSNLSLVNPSSGAIVAGAMAGNFYLSGMAIHPEIQGNNIIDPINGHVYTIQSAGFSTGAYISGGAVIVPQLTLIGWSDGSPVFSSASTFSAGSLFSFLSSGGQAVSNMFQAASSTIQNGIGTVAKVSDNNVVKPLTTGSVANMNTFQSGASKMIASAMGVTAVVDKNIEGAFSNGVAGLSSAVNSIKGTSANIASDTATALMSGYTGVKTGIYSIGAGVHTSIAGVSNGLSSAVSSIENTANHIVSTSTAALSTLYVSMDNYVAGSAGNVYNALRDVTNTSISALDSVGTTFTKTASGFYTSAQNTFGGISSSILAGLNGAKNAAFSFLSAVPSLISHVLMYIGAGALIVVGGIIFFMVWRAKSSSRAVKDIGERNIR